MTRNGTGNAWKHRHDRYSREWRPHRKFKPRELKCEPQFKLDDLYISLMRDRCRYDAEGRVYYEPMERNLRPTGIHVMDDFLNFLSRGGRLLKEFVEKYGLKTSDLDSLVFVLTGMKGTEFCAAYQLRMADELLRYTDLELEEVARKSGVGSANNLYLMYKRDFGVAPGERRKQLRQPGDLGRYRL